MSWLQWGLFNSLLQLLSQLLVRHPEILQQSHDKIVEYTSLSELNISAWFLPQSCLNILLMFPLHALTTGLSNKLENGMFKHEGQRTVIIIICLCWTPKGKIHVYERISHWLAVTSPTWWRISSLCCNLNWASSSPHWNKKNLESTVLRSDEWNKPLLPQGSVVCQWTSSGWAFLDLFPAGGSSAEKYHNGTEMFKTPRNVRSASNRIV